MREAADSTLRHLAKPVQRGLQPHPPHLVDTEERQARGLTGGGGDVVSLGRSEGSIGPLFAVSFIFFYYYIS